MDNLFTEMEKIYASNVKEADKKNTADLYRESFYYVKKILAEEYGLEVSNIHFLDGYFVFGTGTNSVVHFNVKGCKHWRFGVWWVYDEKRDHNQINGEFFCQHTRYLDKFKPSRGTYNFNVYFTEKDGHIEPDIYDSGILKMAKACKFIHKNPYVAAMRDFHGYDYNVQAQEPLKAFIEYTWDGACKWCREKVNSFFTYRLVAYIKRYAKANFDNWEVFDAGNSYSPRYELQVRIEEDSEQETGIFDLFDNDEDFGKWANKIKKFEKAAKFFGTYWYNTEVSDCVIFWKQSEYEKNLKEMEMVDDEE